MREAVDEVIALRAQDPEGLRRMITWSFAIHVGVLVLIAVLPRLGLFKPKSPAPVMVISLGGHTWTALDGHDADLRASRRRSRAGS